MNKNSKKIQELLRDLHQGLDMDVAKKRFKEELGDISASELAQAENALIEEGMPIEDLQELCNVHASVVDKSIEEVHRDLDGSHPLSLFHLENMAFQNHIKHNVQRSAQEYFAKANERNKNLLTQDLERLKKIFVHYDRKENLIFPFLEELSITSIPQVMWGVDDEIRQGLKEVTQLLASSDGSRESIKEIQAKLPGLITEIQGMISKEEDILTPLLRESLGDHHWLQIAKETHIYPIQMLDSNPYAQVEEQEKWIEENKDKNPTPTLEKEISRSQPPSLGSNISLTIDFSTGSLDLKELETIFSTFPMELTFTDRDDKVRYFSDHDNMVFPRPLSSLGRDVMLCHPPKAQPVVRQLLQDFRSGAKDQEVRFLKKGNLLLLIRYFAVRDQEGHYQGCLELVENLNSIPGIKDHLK